MKRILFFILLMLIIDLYAQQGTQSYITDEWQESRYIDHHDGTVSDKITGLMWKKCSEGQVYELNSCNESATNHAWKDALEIATNQTFAGYSDWRVPNIKELYSLVAHNRSLPAINGNIFPHTSSAAFWLSSPLKNSDDAWLLNFSHGDLHHHHGDNLYQVRLVRNQVE